MKLEAGESIDSVDYGFCVLAGGLGGVLRGSSLSGKQR